MVFLWLVVIQCVWGAERAGDTTLLPSEGTDPIFTGSDARYVVTVEAAGARCAVPADFDDDGDMDIVSVSSNDNTVAWYERLRDGTYGPKKMISRASNGARIVTTGDINQDGKIDVIVASYYDHTVGWFENTGGSFGPMNMVTRSANSAQGVSVADLDNDGDLDILSASSGDNTVAWYENLGGGVFCEVKNIVDDHSMGIRTVVAADIDQDGDIDMVVASKDDNRVTWYRNDGNMDFHKIVIDGEAGGSYSLVVTDVDKDGHLDIVGAANAEGKDVSGEGEGGKINFYRGDGKGNFVKIAVTGPNDYDWFALSVWAGDLDGDGDDDIASASFALLHQGSISWYENLDGIGNNWTRHKIYITSTKKTGHFVYGADMDGDGDNDLIAVTNGDDTVQILYAHTGCDKSKINPKRECCIVDQYWNGSQCVSCELGTFKDDSNGSPVCSPCISACPRQGLSFLSKSCWSMPGCYDAAADMKRCDCGENHFLDKDLFICRKCPDGMITLNDRSRLLQDYNMVDRKFLDQTKYMIADLLWQGFNSSRCEIPVCQKGHSFNMSTKDCRPCLAGEYSPGGSVVKCLSCTPGHMCPEESSIPQACHAGFFSVGGQATCTKSPKGKVCMVSGLSAPTACAPGSYADSEGQQECKVCPWGRYAEGNLDGIVDCLGCPLGTTTATVGSKSIKECFCVQGSFHLCHGDECKANFTNPSAANFCKVCPAGAVCKGPLESPNAMITDNGQHRPPYVPPGFMSIETSVYKCGNRGDACPGSPMFAPVERMCAYNGEGVACATCPEGYHWKSTQCSECGNGSALGLVLVCIALLVFCGTFIFYWNEKATKLLQAQSIESVLTSVTIGVTVTFMQTLGVLGQMSFYWPDEVKTVLEAMKLLIFDMELLRLGCVVSNDSSVSMSSLVMPIVVIAMFLAWYPFSRCLNRMCGRFNVFRMDAIWNALGMTIQAFYISIVLSVAKVFDCFSSPNGERTLRISPATICWTGEHINLVIISALAGLVYVIGFFTFLAFVVMQAPVKIVDRSWAIRYRFVFFKYTSTVYWFGLPLMVRSILISLVNVISPDDGYLQFLLMLFILVIFAFLHLTYLPYSDQYANKLETAMLSILIIILGFGSWFLPRDDGTSNADDNPDQARMLSYTLIILLIIFVIIVVCMSTYALYQATHPLQAQKKLQERLERMLPSIRAAGLVLQGVDSVHLIKLLRHASSLDISSLLNVVDYLTVEVGGAQPYSIFRRRLPKISDQVHRSKSREYSADLLITKVASMSMENLDNEVVVINRVDSICRGLSDHGGDLACAKEGCARSDMAKESLEKAQEACRTMQGFLDECANHGGIGKIGMPYSNVEEALRDQASPCISLGPVQGFTEDSTDDGFLVKEHSRLEDKIAELKGVLGTLMRRDVILL